MTSKESDQVKYKKEPILGPGLLLDNYQIPIPGIIGFSIFLLKILCFLKSKANEKQ